VGRYQIMIQISVLYLERIVGAYRAGFFYADPLHH